MKNININICARVYSYEELSDEDRALVDEAKQATYRSYAPYSQFNVGAALRLNDETVVTGSNQENAAYPAALCAERTAIFYANSRYPDHPVKALAIAARNKSGVFTDKPVAPCGVCRQVINETENRYKQPIRILLYGRQGVYAVNSIQDLLPLQFNESDMA